MRPVHEGKRVSLLMGGKVNTFIPNPTFNPIIVPGCLDPLFRGQVPDGVDPRTLMKVEPLREEYQDRDKRIEVMDQQGLGAACCSPPSGAASRKRLSNDIPATMASLSAFNRWLEDDWGFDHEGRLLAAPMLSLADPEAALVEVESLLDRGARIVHVRPAPVPAAKLAAPSRSLGDPLHVTPGPASVGHWFPSLVSVGSYRRSSCRCGRWRAVPRRCPSLPGNGRRGP